MVQMMRVHAPEKKCCRSRQPDSGRFAPRGFANRAEDKETVGEHKPLPLDFDMTSLPLYPPVQAKLVGGNVGDGQADMEAASSKGTGEKAPVARPVQVQPEVGRLEPNRTGMPDRLKTGIEALSGFDMSDVRVHYSSPRPAQLQALAYAKGTNIYVGPGQERHLGHEAWHVVQQKQGRVRATGQMMGNLSLNEDEGLEVEASKMGQAVMVTKPGNLSIEHKMNIAAQANLIVQRTEDDALSIALIYSGRRYRTMEEVVNDWNHFLPNQQLEITNAYNNQLRDASGNMVPYNPLSDLELQDVNNRYERLCVSYPQHLEFLTRLLEFVHHNFGINGVYQFYRGAHIVFHDNLTVYRELWRIGSPLAATATGYPVSQPGYVLDKTRRVGRPEIALLNFPLEILDDELQRGKMLKRRPDYGETSHYANPVEEPVYPQLGLDLPIDIGGHILFGVVPGTLNTFVQTEGAGFQDTLHHVIMHGIGAFWNMAPFVGGWQTGLIGYSRASEKTNSHLESE